MNKSMHSKRGCCFCSSQVANIQESLASGPCSFTRRSFLVGACALTAGGIILSSLKSATAGPATAPKRRPRVKLPLKLQPVLTCHLPERHEAASWRDWGGIQSEKDIAGERARIGKELSALASQAGFPLQIESLAVVQSAEEARSLANGSHDTMLIYAAGGNVQLLEALTNKDKWNLMFLRHTSGPVYLWYEIVHPRFLRKTGDEYQQPGFTVEDIVVDNQADILWRLRALYGLKNTLGKKMVCIGGPSGWGGGANRRKAPARAQELWNINFVDFPYSELDARIRQARQDQALAKRCNEEARKYVSQPGVSLHTKEDFVKNAFVLTEVFRDIMDEADTDAITVNACMGTIMGVAETTACLALSMLNDEDYLALCESDFFAIPAGILLHYVSGVPVFMNDPTFPHDGIVTLAHCTAPRKMDGKQNSPVKIYTHFESDYGAAPKVEMKIGQQCTNLVPDFASKQWLGFEGTIIGNPFMDICRSQIEVQIKGDWPALLKEMKGFHWMMSYGACLQEIGYALRKVGVEFFDVSMPKG